MKISNLFSKGLVITAIASTLVLGAGVAGASASDGRHERNTSGSEHEQGSDHGHDDDETDEEENGQGHETHGQGWGFGHGGDENNCDDEDGSEHTGDDSSDDDAAPVVTAPVADTPVDSVPDTSSPDMSTPATTTPTGETPEIVLEVPAIDAATDFRVASPEVVPATDQISASPSETVQPQIVVEVPEIAGDSASSPSLTDVVENQSTQQTAQATTSSLPMTGASGMVLLGLAVILLATGWLVIAGRRSNSRKNA